MYSVCVNSDTELSMVVNQEQTSKAIDKATGEICEETDSLRILDEFRKLYEGRIERVNQEPIPESDRVSLKLQIMMEWIKDLGEQNIMLVRTIDDLERAACSTVKLLEEKLQQSSRMVTQNMLTSNRSGETVSMLSNRISKLQKADEQWQQKIEFLRSDIRGLLELIKRASVYNIWSLEGITFLEIQESDIPLPQDCKCDQEQNESDEIQSLKLQIQQLQENEKNLLEHQVNLEDMVRDLSTKLSAKGGGEKSTIPLQLLSKELVKCPNSNTVTCDSIAATGMHDSDIMSMVENLLVEKDLELERSRRQIQNTDSKIVTQKNESNVDIHVQFEDKCKEIQEMKQRMVHLKKESLEIREALEAKIEEKESVIISLHKKINELENLYKHTSIQIDFKDDIIKKMRKEVKRTQLKNICGLKKVHIDTEIIEKDYYNVPSNITQFSNKDDIVSCLTNAKLLMEKEQSALHDLKLELQKVLEKRRTEEICNTDENKPYVIDISEKLVTSIADIHKMFLAKDKALTLIDTTINECNTTEVSDKHYDVSQTTMIQLFKLMEEFRVCTVEAQAGTEDIREEISDIITAFHFQNEMYKNYNGRAIKVKDQLTKRKEVILEAINKLEFHNQERMRFDHRIVNGRMRLKDVKNEINQMQANFSHMQEDIQVDRISSCLDLQSRNELINSMMDAVDQIVTNIQGFQSQECCVGSILEQLKNELCVIECVLKELQKETIEVLIQNEAAQSIFSARQERLGKFEIEIDNAHSKMQDVLKTFLCVKEQTCSSNSLLKHQTEDQVISEMLKVKENLHKVRKEYDDFKLKTLQHAYQIKYDEKINKWNCEIAELQDQVRILHHEAKCNQQTNNFLKQTVDVIEKELKSRISKSNHTVDKIDLTHKLLEEESMFKSPKDAEYYCNNSVNYTEIDCKEHGDVLDAALSDQNIETIPLRCGYQTKHENTAQLQIFQDKLKSVNVGLRDLRKIFGDSAASCFSNECVMTVLNNLKICEENLHACFQEFEKVKNALFSKDKLLIDKDEIIRIQKNSLTMSQAEVQDLHQKAQEKVDSQNLIMSQFEKEKKELIRQNELQVQTIRHLQDAVVEAKRSLDHMGQKAIGDLHDKNVSIQMLTTFIKEVQSQYNKCFAEAAAQDTLLELQRDAINHLQNKIYKLLDNQNIMFVSVHFTYYKILSRIQKNLQTYVQDFHDLRCKMDTFMQSKSCLRTECTKIKRLWQDANSELEELRGKYGQNRAHESKQYQASTKVGDKVCNMRDITLPTCLKDSFSTYTEADKRYGCYDNLNADIDILMTENIDMKMQLQKYKLDREILDQELTMRKEPDVSINEVKTELCEIQNIKYSLAYENKELKMKLEEHIKESQNCIKKLQLIREKKTDVEKQAETMVSRQCQLKAVFSDITKTKAVITEYIEAVKELQEKLNVKKDNSNSYISESKTSKNIYSTLQNRIYTLKRLLTGESDNMAKMEADYEVLKNNYAILKVEMDTLLDKAQKDSKELQEVRFEVYLTKNDYQRVSKDFHKAQEQLIEAANREVELQKLLTTLQQSYRLNLLNLEVQNKKLGYLSNPLCETLENIQNKISVKNLDLAKVQTIYKSRDSEMDMLKQRVTELQGKLMAQNERNSCILHQLQVCLDEYHALTLQKNLLEQDNFGYIRELQKMYVSLIDLQNKDQLKTKSLECISAELNEATMSRSELYNEYLHMVSCIRTCVVEQRDVVKTLNRNLTLKQQQLIQLASEKKVFLTKIKDLKLANNILRQRLIVSRKRGCIKHTGYAAIKPTANSSHFHLHKKWCNGTIRIAHSTSIHGNYWWLQKLEYLANELRNNNQLWIKNDLDKQETFDATIEDNRDYGYQSSNSK